MGTGDEGRLRAIVTEVTAARGCDLEELTVRSMGRRRVVRVVVDSDRAITLDDAADLSREISERLDGPDDPTGEHPYTLEVTSPGIGRPLREPRHFRRARGRLIALTTVQGPVSGHLLRADDTGIELAVTSDEQGDKKGDKKGTVRTVELPYGEISGAKVEVEFSAPPAAVQELLDKEGVGR